MPTLIDCHSLKLLKITNNRNLTLLDGASLQTCTTLIELILYRNNDLIASNTAIANVVYPHLKILDVSVFSILKNCSRISNIFVVIIYRLTSVVDIFSNIRKCHH
jgi:hypothetical protein